MVSLNGAKECPPLVAQIDTLTAAIAQLETAIAANGLITFIQFNYLEGPEQRSRSVIIKRSLIARLSLMMFAIFSTIKRHSNERTRSHYLMATTYYISPTGNDSTGTGTGGNPG